MSLTCNTSWLALPSSVWRPHFDTTRSSGKRRFSADQFSTGRGPLFSQVSNGYKLNMSFNYWRNSDIYGPLTSQRFFFKDDSRILSLQVSTWLVFPSQWFVTSTTSFVSPKVHGCHACPTWRIASLTLLAANAIADIMSHRTDLERCFWCWWFFLRLPVDDSPGSCHIVASYPWMLYEKIPTNLPKLSKLSKLSKPR